jgi:hypothetical protein
LLEECKFLYIDENYGLASLAGSLRISDCSLYRDVYKR